MIEILSIHEAPSGPATESSRDLPALTEYFQDRQAAPPPVPGRDDILTIERMAEDVAEIRVMLQQLDDDLAALRRMVGEVWNG